MKFLLLTSYSIAFFQPFLAVKNGLVQENPLNIQWSEDTKTELVDFTNFVDNVVKARVSPQVLLCESGMVSASSVPSVEELSRTGSITGEAGGNFENFGLTAQEMHQIATYIQKYKESFKDGAISAGIILCESDFAHFLLLVPKYAEIDAEKRDDAHPKVQRPRFRTKEQLEAYINYLKNKITLQNYRHPRDKVNPPTTSKVMAESVGVVQENGDAPK